MAMSGWRRLKGLLPAAAISLAVASPAFAVPAGSEYVPKVPKAAGEEILRGNQGAGGTILSPEVRGSGQAPGSRPSNSGSTASSGDEPSEGDVAQGDLSQGTAPGATETLLDPIVLLLIVGVAAAALSMTLRQRRSVAGDPDADGESGDLSSGPPAPDGEIIDREPRS
jgi:hypothetical protein